MSNSKPSSVKETDRLFVPIARILSSYVGSSGQDSVPKANPSNPLTSEELNQDVIIQNAYTRCSYDDEFEMVPDFVLDPHLPDSWSIDDVKSFLGVFAAPVSSQASLRMVAPALGLTPISSPSASAPTDVAIDQFRRLLQSMDKSPSVSLAHAIFSGYMDHLEIVFEHAKSLTIERRVVPMELDIVNEDPIFSIPMRVTPLPAPLIEHLPSRCPSEVLKHFDFLLCHSQLDFLPSGTLLTLLSQWFPEDKLARMSWCEELRQEALKFWQKGQLQALSRT